MADEPLGDARYAYWLFLLALTTGARLEEVGQAAIADVKTRDGIRYIDIDDYVENDSEESKSLKTPNSRRLLPIHDRLMELGFERYLAALNEMGHTQPFPDLKSVPSASERKKLLGWPIG
jgi:integrase